MRQRPAHDDLSQFSRTTSVDEELLLTLYRRSSWEDRTATLFRLSRLHFAPFFAAHFSREQDAKDSSYLDEEIEQRKMTQPPRKASGGKSNRKRNYRVRVKSNTTESEV